MPGTIVNPLEATVLLQINDSSTIVDLAGATHLAPTAVREILARLENRGLVDRHDDKGAWSLTVPGLRARNSLAHGSSSNTYVVLDDRHFPTSQDESALDKALDRAFEKKI